MRTFNYNKNFLKLLDDYPNKTFWVKIEVLNFDETPMSNIEGRVQPGSTINISGNSSVRRTCNINFVVEEEINDLTNIDNLLAINKKIKIFEGIKNKVDENYDDVVWFPLGVFIIVQPNITHNVNGCIVSLSCKDKMCLLNGECAGGLPTSVIFDHYDQTIGQMVVDADPRTKITEPNNYTIYKYTNKDNIDYYYKWTEIYGWETLSESDAIDLIGSTIETRQRIYDIIQTLVCNYGGESLDKIFINDVPLKIKQLVRYTGTNPLYFRGSTGVYTLNINEINESDWIEFDYGEDCGYVYTDFTYPTKKHGLTSSIGDNVCTILDKIKNTLGNYEYFYDVEGNFIFQEIKNYLNNSYDITNTSKLDNNRNPNVTIESNNLYIINDDNYKVDFHSNTKSVYTFNEDSGLITAFSNSPNYTNVKNDFHIWGENDDGYAIHYHLVIKEKPKVFNEYNVIFLTDKKGKENGRLRLATAGETGVKYIPSDWRAELYLQGLTAKAEQKRPDIYQQELLDLFDDIYDFYEDNENGNKGKFKADLVNKPNILKYFFDYISPMEKLYNCSVDLLNPKVYSYKQDKMNRLYNTYVPDLILLNSNMDSKTYDRIKKNCESQGQQISNVDNVIYSKIAEGTSGYTAQEVARDLLYQYTNYNESISITSLPIYYLDVNTRITVQDRKSNISGDFIINTISLPLDAGGNMTINASRALERI